MGKVWLWIEKYQKKIEHSNELYGNTVVSASHFKILSGIDFDLNIPFQPKSRQLWTFLHFFTCRIFMEHLQCWEHDEVSVAWFPSSWRWLSEHSDRKVLPITSSEISGSSLGGAFIKQSIARHSLLMLFPHLILQGLVGESSGTNSQRLMWLKASANPDDNEGITFCRRLWEKGTKDHTWWRKVIG